jgi:membrane dipeptidase
MQVATTAQALEAHTASGVHAVLPAIQGANALQAAADLDSELGGGWLTRVTLVHLTDSIYGATSSPLSLRRHKGLTEQGAQMVHALNRHRIWVDLAHAHPQTFAAALAVHDANLPPIATHTGVCGVRPHWRNLDDAQLRALADRGGVIGVIAAANFLGPADPAIAQAQLGGYLLHLEHILTTAGEQAAAIGTDLDGAIVPPLGLRDGIGHLRLVAAMLQRGWTTARIQAVCRGNFLRAWRRLRPDGWQAGIAGS